MKIQFKFQIGANKEKTLEKTFVYQKRQEKRKKK